MKLKEFIKNNIPNEKEYKKEIQGICGICGEEQKCYKDIVSDNFNNYEDVINPYFCLDCAKLFHSDFRKKSFYITEKEAKLIMQKDILPIFNNIEFPCIFSFTESNKKHRLFRSRISYSKDEVFMILDDDIITFNLDEDLEVMNKLDEIYKDKNNKICKEWIIKGNMPPNAIQRFGLENYLKMEELVKKYRGSRKLVIMVAFLNKEIKE